MYKGPLDCTVSPHAPIPNHHAHKWATFRYNRRFPPARPQMCLAMRTRRWHNPSSTSLGHRIARDRNYTPSEQLLLTSTSVIRLILKSLGCIHGFLCQVLSAHIQARTEVHPFLVYYFGYYGKLWGPLHCVSLPTCGTPCGLWILSFHVHS